MNVLFLDYDGVVNTPMWEIIDGKPKCRYNFARDNKVNNYQACQWISEFCEMFDYKIVVTSTWRFSDNYADCLRNGGLRDSVEIIGKTRSVFSGSRSDEITAYLIEHPEVERYIIIDDDIVNGFGDHFINCTQDCGFNISDFDKVIEICKSGKDRR